MPKTKPLPFLRHDWHIMTEADLLAVGRRVMTIEDHLMTQSGWSLEEVRGWLVRPSVAIDGRFPLELAVAGQVHDVYKLMAKENK